MNRAGEAIESIEGLNNLLQAPPISVLLDQQEVVETRKSTSEGVKKASYIEQSLYSVACAVSPDGPVVLALDIVVKLDTPTAFPVRTLVTLRPFQPLPFLDTVAGDCSNGFIETNGDMNGHPTKRRKVDTSANSNGSTASPSPSLEDVIVEATRLAELLSIAIESKSE